MMNHGSGAGLGASTRLASQFWRSGILGGQVVSGAEVG